MNPHGGYRRVWPEDRDRLNRTSAKREAMRAEEEAGKFDPNGEDFEPCGELGCDECERRGR